ncbi:NACHT domain-containing protein [Actinomadura formosensis]|uniref:NACHT domain-containing protein n=1 Tax=Actinomadura formosensis TaxID=60706 RepID=UPI003D92DBF7
MKMSAEEPRRRIKGRGGRRPKGIKRPEPDAGNRAAAPWGALACLIYDELYDPLQPADRLGQNELGKKAAVSAAHMSNVFSGTKSFSWEVCQAIVVALGGDPVVWKKRWEGANRRYEQGLELGEYLPLPGVDLDEAKVDISARSVADWDLRRMFSRFGARRPFAVACIAIAIAAPLLLSAPLLSELEYVFPVAIGLMIAAAAIWLLWRRRVNIARRQYRIMLKKVRRRAQEIADWAERPLYLAPAFTRLAPIPGGPARSRGMGGAAGELPRQELGWPNIRALYEDADDGLVLLAEPGCGKSIQMARLAYQLADEAIIGLDDSGPELKDLSDCPPIPILLSLSSYRGEPLADWIITEVHRTYGGINKRILRAWLDEAMILPLLDGLDRVPQKHRRECARQVRRHREECKGIVVSARSRDYRLTRKINSSLYVEIDRPTRQQVQDYLATNAEALAGVFNALKVNQNLWELLRSPLMLNIVYHTYSGEHAAELRSGNADQWERRVFDAYLRRMLTEHSTKYSPRQTVEWLTWLARTMTSRDEDILYVELLQPEVLAIPADRQKVRDFLTFKVTLWLGTIVSFSWLFATQAPIYMMLITTVMLVSLYPYLVGKFRASQFEKEIWTSRIEPLDNLNWEFSRATVIPFTCGWIGGFIFTWGSGWKISILAGFAMALWATMEVAARQEPSASFNRTRPNQAMRRVGFNAVVVLVLSLFASIAAGILLATEFSYEEEVVGSPLVILLQVFLTWWIPLSVMTYGGETFLRHCTLRWLLYRRGNAPLRYVRFLSEAEGQTLVRRVGCGFAFPHRLIQEHLNSRADTLLRRLALNADGDHVAA